MINVIHTGPFGVNSLVVNAGGQDVFIVDPACCSFCHDENVITDYIESNKFNVAAIILTHGHFDHVAGLSVLKSVYPDVPVLIHAKDRDCIGADSALVQAPNLYAMGFQGFIPSVSNLPNADFFLADNKTLLECMNEDASLINTFSINAKELLSQWKVLHTPGHTKGCVCLYNEKEKSLISGDTLFYKSWGRTDLVGGNENEIMQSLNRIKQEIPNDTKVFPGHDAVGFTILEGFPL